MDTAPPPANHWHRYHSNLQRPQAKQYQQAIQRVLGISQSAFYRKLKHPALYLTIAEKQAIARIYRLSETYLFPELAAMDLE
jgi:hypothetical protein